MIKKVSLGLDIGIASVGWSVIDIETKTILKAGVRLFEEAGTGVSAVNTRTKRGARRRSRRGSLRKRELIETAISFNLIKDKSEIWDYEFDGSNMLELKKFALENPVKKVELVIIALNYFKHRGTFSLDDDINNAEENKQKKETPYEMKFAKNKLPIERQYELYKKYGKFRGMDENYTEIIDGDSYIVPYLFTHQQYLEELTILLDKQVENGVCPEEFKQKCLELFNRKRHYSDGPGKADKSKLSKWGWEKGDFINKSIGKDTYDRNEFRASKECLTSNIFNALNALNNICFSSNKKLTKQERVNLIRKLIEGEVNTKGVHKTFNVNKKNLKEILKEEDESKIKGLTSEDVKGPIIEFKAVNKLVNLLKKGNLDFQWINYDNYLNNNLDKVFEILTIQQTIEDRKQKLIDESFSFLNDNIINSISRVSLSGTHSLSIKTMKKLIEIMLNDGKNHNQALKVLNMSPDYSIDVKNHTNLKSTPLYKRVINEMYISPVVKRALIESIKVVKEIEKWAVRENYEIEFLVIELAREKNSENLRKIITDFQKRNAITNNKIQEMYKIDLSKNISQKLRLKLRLFLEQDGKSIYSGKPIDLDKLISDPYYCEIDHIIPISFSIDDSVSNKVLCLKTENHNKSNQTPYQWLSQSDYNNMRSRINEYQKYISQLYGKKYAAKKVQNLLCEENVSDIKNSIKFISRNLNDTRYATKEVMNYFKYIRNEFKDSLQGEFKIRAINGSFTSYLRKDIFNKLEPKNRDEFKHHGVDATIIALSPFIKLYKNHTVDDVQTRFDDKNVNINLVEEQDRITELNEQYSKIAEYINDYNFVFTKKVYKRVNTELANDTIYSLRKSEDNSYHKDIRLDIFATDKTTIEKLVDIFHNGNDKNVYMKTSDQKTFNYLKDIFEEFHCKNIIKSGNKNPFIHYRDVLKKNICKQSNEENPPLVKKIKVAGEKKVGSFIDISNKFKNLSKDKKVVLESPSAIGWDIYYSKELRKIKLIAIDVRVLKMGSFNNTKDIDSFIITDSYNRILKDNNINNSYIKKARIFKYDLVDIVTSKGVEYTNHVVTGYSPANNKLEIKPIDRRIQNRILISINSLNKLDIIYTNITGGRKKLIKIVE